MSVADRRDRRAAAPRSGGFRHVREARGRRGTRLLQPRGRAGAPGRRGQLGAADHVRRAGGLDDQVDADVRSRDRAAAVRSPRTRGRRERAGPVVARLDRAARRERAAVMSRRTLARRGAGGGRADRRGRRRRARGRRRCDEPEVGGRAGREREHARRRRRPPPETSIPAPAWSATRAAPATRGSWRRSSTAPATRSPPSRASQRPPMPTSPASCWRTATGSCTRSRASTRVRTKLTLANLMDSLPRTNDPGCSAGYAHGLVTAVAPEIEKAGPKTANQLCVKSETRYQRYSCTHGFGHAFMRLNNEKLEPALQMCRELGTGAAPDCAQGIYHDYWFAVNGIDDTVKPENPVTDPRELCGAQPEEFVRPCWYRAFVETAAGTRTESGRADRRDVRRARGPPAQRLRHRRDRDRPARPAQPARDLRLADRRRGHRGVHPRDQGPEPAQLRSAAPGRPDQ